MVDVIIAFDSEDLTTPAAADAELWWAEALRTRGIRGSFQIVTELVRALRRWGREDVIKAFAAHEVGYHSNQHSVPPHLPEVCEGLPLQEAISAVIRAESAGMAELASTFGSWPISYCPPGDSWTVPHLLAMASMGVRVFCNDKLAHPTRRPYWYCGMLVGNYDFDFMEFFEKPDLQPGEFEQRFESLRAATPEDGIIIVYTHPTRLMTADFWDAPLYAGKVQPLASCPPAPLRPQAEIQRNKDRCSRFLDWMRAHKDIRFTDFATLYGERVGSRRGLDTLLAENGLLPGQEGRLPLRTSGADAFLPSTAQNHKRFEWPLYHRDFTGGNLLKQVAGMTWTGAAAPRNRR